MTQTLGWLTHLEISGSLSISECELNVGTEYIRAFISSEKARMSPIDNGLVKMEYAINKSGVVIVEELEPVLPLFDYAQYQQVLTQFESNKVYLLSQFLKLNEAITHPLLQPFVQIWQKKPDLLNLFLMEKASFRHHHSYQHGLLIHSMEVAVMAYKNSKTLNHSDDECQIALVGGLFHDIGKLFPMLTKHSSYIPSEHECQSWLILQSELDELAMNNYQWYEVMADIFKPQTSKNIVNRIETVVRSADKASADSDNSQLKFNGAPSFFHFIQNGDQLYRRIKP